MNKETEKKEEKIGVVPADEIKGSDADKAYADDAPETEKQAKETKGSDADHQ